MALFPNLLHFLPSFLAVFLSSFACLSIPLPLLNNTHGSNEGGDGQEKDGLTAKENLKSQTCGAFCFGNARVNCNVFTAAIALNGPCIMGHHYSGETHRAWVIADCSPAPRELDEG